MKIQLDTENKTIKLDSDVKLSELVDTLEKLLPKGEWKEYELQTNTVIRNWSNPIIIRDHYDYPWWRNPVVTCSKTDSTGKYTPSYNTGDLSPNPLYNIQC